MNDREYIAQMIESGDIADPIKVYSLIHHLSDELIVELYHQFKDRWIRTGVFTYYAEDFIKYQDSFRLYESAETIALSLIYEALERQNGTSH